MENLHDDIQEAYLKLKRNQYYERLNILSRDSFVKFDSQFENDINKLEKKLKTIGSWLTKTEDPNTLPLTVKRLLKNIRINSFVKEISEQYNSDDPNFISDQIELFNYDLKRENFHITLPVELQIFGVLWLEKIGKSLDKSLSPYSFGNRMIQQGEDDITFKGKLFKQYQQQYAKWWKGGLSKAKQILREDRQDVILLNFDVKSYYHSIQLELKKLRKKIKFEGLTTELKTLHCIIENVIVIYNKKLKKYKRSKNDSHLALPIGFLPAHVIANWYLDKFDKKVIKLLRPSYYGRYVDDIFIVFKSTLPSHNKIRERDKILLELLQNSNIESLSHSEYCFLTYFSKYFKISGSTSKKRKFKFKEAKGLELQTKKLFAYELKVGSPINLIENFIKEQRERSSEFRFESEESDKIPSDFGDVLFEQSFQQDDPSKAKIKKVSENKFELSVFLSRLIKRSSTTKNRKYEGQFRKIISHYRGSNIIKAWWVWEKIILALVINHKRQYFKTFIREAHTSINNLTSETLSSKILNETKATMLAVLKVTIKNAIASDPSFITDSIKKELTKLELYEDYDSVRQTAFVRHEYLPFPLIGLLKRSIYSQDSFLSIDSFEEQIFEIHPFLKKYSPIPVKYWQLVYLEWYRTIKAIKTESSDSINRTFIHGNDLNNEKILLDAFSTYYDINCHPSIIKEEFRDKYFFESAREEIIKHPEEKRDPRKYGLIKHELCIKGNKQDSIRLALVNEEVNKNNFVSSASGVPNLEKRLENCREILDEAQSKKADLCIQPELSVPHSFLPTYFDYSAKHQLGITAGIEHLRIKNVVYNFILTVIPITIKGVYKDSVPLLRLKNHYAPREEDMIQSKLATVPKPLQYEYQLFNWKGLYFSNYYCYELADINHRALFQGEIDVLVAPVWNPDTNYYNGVVESGAREIHCIFSIVNTANYGFTRWTLPSKTELKNKIISKGGTTSDFNYTMSLIDYNPKQLRDFQLTDYKGQIDDGRFKPTPPDFPKQKAKMRNRGEHFYIKSNEND